MSETNLNQLLSFLTAALFLILGLLTVIKRYRDRVTDAFAMLVLVLSAAGWVGLWVEGAATVEQFAFRVRFSFVTFGLTPLFILNHVLAISGYHHRREDRLLGVRLRTWVWMLVLLDVVMVGLILIPGLVVRGFGMVPGEGFKPMYRLELIGLMILVMVLIFFFAVYLTVRALREARAPSQQHFMRLNVAGALMILLALPLFGVIFPALGLPGEFMIHVSMLVASLIFFHAINRHQLDQFNELNQELEAKVVERTRHLEEAQERLVRSEKLAAVGRLAAGVTHEVNNPMGAILSAADTMGRSLSRLQRRTLDRELSRKELERTLSKTLTALEQSNTVLQSAWERVQGLMSSLQGFVGLDAATFQQVDLNRCLDDTVVLLGAELGDGIEVARCYGELPPVLVSRADLSELLGHLLRNAAQAVKGEGRVALNTRAVEDGVELQVADSGPGFPEDKLAGLFEPRFSSSGPRVKLGVGLATSYRIAEQHGGTLSAANSPGGGAVLTLRLPVGAVPD